MPPTNECVTHHFRTSRYDTDNVIQQDLAEQEMANHVFEQGKTAGAEETSWIGAVIRGEEPSKPVSPCMVVVHPD